MADEILKRDQNFVTVLGGVTDDVSETITMLRVDPTSKRLLVSATGLPGGGTVTDVSVVTANGFAGTVATSTSTPAITLSTTVTGILQGDGTAISAASTTGSGTVVLANTPTLITPVIGSATGTSLTVSGTLRSNTSLILEETGAGTDTITIQAPSSIATPYILTLPVDDGTNGQILTTDGSGVLSWSNAGGTGDVVGPASSTDNAIVRFDGTTGKLIQNSVVTIGDTGAISDTIANTGNVVALTIVQNDTSNNPKAVSVTNAGTGNSIFIDANGDTGNSASVSGALLLENTGNPGIGANFYSNHAAPTGAGLVFMKHDNASANKPVLRIDNDGTSNGIIINQNGHTGTTSGVSGGLTLVNTNNTGFGLQVYSNAGASAGALVYIEADNASFDQPTLHIKNLGTSGAAASIRLDGVAPQIEFVETDQVSPAGKFELEVQGDIFFLNGRNSADNSFLNMFIFQRNGDTVNQIQFDSAATNNPPTISAVGSDTNIDLVLSGKGTGAFKTTSPKIVTSINDTNGNEEIKLTATSSAVNEITIANAATGNDPVISATGGDTNISLKIHAKGTGKLKLGTADLQWPNSDGTSGQVIKTDGSGNLSFVTPPNSTVPVVNNFTSTGTWTKQPNLLFIIVAGVAPGGGGGGCTTSSHGDSGGSGGYFWKLIPAASLAATESVVIGTKGTGGAAGNNDGTDGSGVTSFGALCSANPGTGGQGNAGGAGTGGTATGGDTNITGQNGGVSMTIDSANRLSGTGGSTLLGLGAAGIHSPSDGNDATGFGSAGSGAAGDGSGAHAGGDGTDGYLALTEYYI